jgi:multiple sugar transport system substrate-binding protein
MRYSSFVRRGAIVVLALVSFAACSSEDTPGSSGTGGTVGAGGSGGVDAAVAAKGGAAGGADSGAGGTGGSGTGGAAVDGGTGGTAGAADDGGVPDGSADAADDGGGAAGGAAGGSDGGVDAADAGPGDGGVPDGGGDAGAGTVELRVSWWGSPDRDMRTTKALALFMDKHPSIKITVEHYANTQGTGIVGTDYWPTLNAHAADHTLPDVMQHDYAYIADWNKRELLWPLDDYTKDGTLDLSDVSAAAVDGGKVGGKIVGVALGINTQTIVLDTNAFAEANIALPSDNWTWDDFETLALALHQKLGIFGFGTGLHGYTPGWKAVTLSKGKWVWSQDGKALGYDDDAPWIAHWKMILRLKAAGALPRLDQEPMTSNIEAVPLAVGKAAMEFAHSNQLVALWTAAGTARTLKEMPVPKVAGGKSPVYVKPSQYFSVTATSKHPKEAAMLISFFTNDVDANLILGGERGMPIAGKVLAALKPSLSKMAKESFDIVERVAPFATALPPTDPPAWDNILKFIFIPKIEKGIMTEAWTPEAAVADFRSEASAVLLGMPVPDGGPPAPADAGAGDAAADAATDAGADAATDAGASDAAHDAAADAGG